MKRKIWTVLLTALLVLSCFVVFAACGPSADSGDNGDDTPVVTPGGPDEQPETPGDPDEEPETPGDPDEEPDAPDDSGEEPDTPDDPDVPHEHTYTGEV